MSDKPYGYVVEIRRTHDWTWREATQDYGYEVSAEPWYDFITAGCGELTIFSSIENATRSIQRWGTYSPEATYRVIPVILDEPNATAWESVPPRN